jgi:hypothetical protein
MPARCDPLISVAGLEQVLEKRFRPAFDPARNRSVKGPHYRCIIYCNHNSLGD